MKPFSAIFVHGVGQQAPTFAEDARHWLRGAMAERGYALSSTHAHWAPLADRHEAKFLERAERSGSKGNALQRLVVGTLADALMYTTSPALRLQIFNVLDQAYVRLPSEPVTIFAHSLGVLCALDWLRARPMVKNVSLVGMGVNVGLFHLDRPLVMPAQLTWGNVWALNDRSDMLGYPLNHPHIKDVTVNVGGVLKSWNGLAHVGYWDSRRLWKKTIPALLFPVAQK